MQYKNLSQYAIILLACVACGCGEDEAPPDSCEDLETSAPSAAIASSPRAESGLEQLTLAITNSVVAQQANYDQVVQDVESIKNQFPKVAGVSVPPRESTGFLVETTSEDVATQMVAGSYTEWDCLNDHFGPAEVNDLTMTSVLVTLPHVLHPTLVPEMYANLPDIERTAASPPTDGPTICAKWEDDRRLYLFDDASGDCVAGCTWHELSLFSVDADGNVAEQTVDEDITRADEAPGFACPADTWPASQ